MNTSRECPECGSVDVVDAGGVSGIDTSTYARITYRYKCLDCGNWFEITCEYDKTKPNERSQKALQQARSGEMNEYPTLDALIDYTTDP